jgi:hypothetical protein
MIASVLTWYVPDSSSENLLYIKITSVWLFFLCILVLPVMFWFVLTRNVKKFKKRHFEIRWGALYNRLRLNNKPQMFYYGLFILRRAIYVLMVAEGMNKTPVFQVITLNLTNLFVLMYFAMFMPKNSLLHNGLEIMNEI